MPEIDPVAELDGTSGQDVQALNTSVIPTQILVITPGGQNCKLADMLWIGGSNVLCFTHTDLLDKDGASCPCVDSWRPHLDWADLIITDSVLVLYKATASKISNKLIFAGSVDWYKGIGNVLVLNDNIREPKKWWKFWS